MNKITPIKTKPINLFEKLFLLVNKTFVIIIIINNNATIRNEKMDNCRWNGNSAIIIDRLIPLIYTPSILPIIKSW